MIKRILFIAKLSRQQLDEKIKEFVKERKSLACMGTAKVGCGGLAISSLRGAGSAHSALGS